MKKAAPEPVRTKTAPTTEMDTQKIPASIRRPRGAVAAATVSTNPLAPAIGARIAHADPVEVEDPAPRRQWLTEDEVERIIRHAAGDRDRLMILVAYRHGLRVSELIHLRWQQVNLDTGRLAVRRLKGSENSVHPLSGREIRSLRKLRRRQPVGSGYVFVTDRGAPLTRNGFYKLLEKAAARAGIADVHPHLLRHGTGYRLVNHGMDTLSLAAYLGHANIHYLPRRTMSRLAVAPHEFDANGTRAGHSP
jgi:type 1 fimbriae regulatory protein FimE